MKKKTDSLPAIGALLCVFVAVTTASAGTPLLTNGSLTGTPDRGVAAPGWTIANSTPDLVNQDGPFNNTGVPWTLSPDGGTFARGNGHLDPQFREAFEQSVSGFTIGDCYRLDFSQTNLGFRTTFDEWFERDGYWGLLVDDTLVGQSATIGGPASHDVPIQWSSESISFAASSTTHVIRLQAFTAEQEISYLGIDGLTLVGEACAGSTTSTSVAVTSTTTTIVPSSTTTSTTVLPSSTTTSIVPSTSSTTSTITTTSTIPTTSTTMPATTTSTIAPGSTTTTTVMGTTTTTTVPVGCVGAPDGTVCDDGDDCTMDDACMSGICVGTPVSDGPCGPTGGHVAGDGKGKPEADCFVGLAGYSEDDQSPYGKKGKPAFQCMDCDPSCDFDGTGEADDACTFSIAMRVNADDVEGCVPAELKSVKGKAKSKGTKIDFATSFDPPLDGSSATSAFVDFPVRTKKKGTKPGTGKLIVSAQKAGKPKLKDKDKFLFVCLPRPAGEQCPVLSR